MEFWIVTSQDLFYLQSALDLANLAIAQRDVLKMGEYDSPKACVLGAVMCSASFLECSINGLYDYARRPVRTTKLHHALATVWSEAFDRQPMLAKYQIALALAKREAFLASAEPYQSTSALLDLRNAIAHPKELGESEAQRRKLEARLNGMFAFNPKKEHRRDFFPDRCLSCDCAFWAVETAASFFLEFQRRMPRTAYVFVAESTIRSFARRRERSAFGNCTLPISHELESSKR